jgi:type VI secretion system protein ImpC
MAEKISSASFEFSVRPGSQPRAEAARTVQKRFNVVVLGDFTGRTSRAVVEPLDSRKLLAVDCDNFERVLSQLAPKITLNDGASSADLTFHSLDDFHPDKLLSRASPLTKLLEARQLLLNPTTAAQGKGLLEAYLGSAIGGPADPATGEPPKAESDDQTMARLLGGAPPASPAPTAGKSNVEQLIRKLVAPHVAPASAPGQQGALAAADIELAKKLRAMLHHPDFQSLEAAWRGLDFLIRRIEAVEDIGVLLLDISPAELEPALAAEPGGVPPLLRLLRDRKVSFIAANYVFGRTAVELQVLGKMAGLAAQLGAPFIATADPRLVGCDSFGLHPDPDDWKLALAPDAAAAWQGLRQLGEADHVSLAAPRFLLRQPYGKSGETIESFPFEELPGEPAHEEFLWGHPAMLCACLLIDAFQSQLDDEEAEPPAGGEVGDLPTHTFTSGGETAIKPYAEAWLTERAAVRLANGGILPLLSRKDYNSIQIPDLYSVASPPRRLAVRWK